MDLPTLRRFRRALGAAVSLSAIALVMAKTRGPGPEAGANAVGMVAALAFVGSLALLILVWRKEHAADRAGFADRERKQLALFQLQLTLAKKKADGATREPTGR